MAPLPGSEACGLKAVREESGGASELGSPTVELGGFSFQIKYIRTTPSPTPLPIHVK